MNHPIRLSTVLGSAALVLALAACSQSSATQGPVDSTAPSVAASASPAGTARCEASTDASPAATINLSGLAFDAEATITVGQTVAFNNQDGMGHTVTEGSEGTAAADACVNAAVPGGATVLVTFNQTGDYQITCRIHSFMHTVVHVS